VKQADLLDIFREALKGVYTRTSTAVVPSDSLSPAPSTSSAMKTPENTEVPGDSGPADGEDIHNE
jgi:hypothetical protein